MWGFVKDEKGNPKKDPSLQDPRCVLQLLKQHYSRYDPKTVSDITGTPEDELLKVYEMFSATGQKGKAGTVMYAMGWTQHTVGTQNIRAMSIIQLLLGNMGIAGGGVNALRGESNVQGSTDHCILFDTWPGYLKTPGAGLPTLAAYNQKNTPTTNDPLSANWWGNYSKYSVSLLKSYFGHKGTKGKRFRIQIWMPRLDEGKAYSWLDLFDAMYRGDFTGFFAWGQNPAASGADARKNRDGLAQLDWMVNVNIFDNLKPGPSGKDPAWTLKRSKPRFFSFPAPFPLKKKGPSPTAAGGCNGATKRPIRRDRPWPDGRILMKLGDKLKELYKKDGVFPEPILNLKWDYTTHGEFDSRKMAKEINGYFLKDMTIKGKHFKKGKLVPSFAYLQDDGSTSSGNWLYCNSYTEKGNMAARRTKEKSGIGLNPQWAWCWPVNRRILYNRASVDLYGKPWNPECPVYFLESR